MKKFKELSEKRQNLITYISSILFGCFIMYLLAVFHAGIDPVEAFWMIPKALIVGSLIGFSIGFLLRRFKKQVLWFLGGVLDIIEMIYYFFVVRKYSLLASTLIMVIVGYGYFTDDLLIMGMGAFASVLLVLVAPIRCHG